MKMVDYRILTQLHKDITSMCVVKLEEQGIEKPDRTFIHDCYMKINGPVILSVLMWFRKGKPRTPKHLKLNDDELYKRLEELVHLVSEKYIEANR